jgi:putative flippase GtrA
VPVDWVDDPLSTVDIASTARADLRGVARLMRGPQLARQVGRFTAIGVVSTVAYVALYVLLRGGLGAFSANTVALAVTAVANTAANRRLTFGVTRRAGMVRHQLQGLGVFVLALAMSSAALALLHTTTPHPSRLTEVTALVAANVAASALRFVLLKHWVFRNVSPTSPPR